MKTVITIFCVAIMMISCDEVFDYNFIIQNQADKEIAIIYTTGNLTSNYSDTVYLSPSSDTLFFVQHAAGGRELRGVDIGIVFEELIIMMDSLPSIKDYRNTDNWEYSEQTDNIGQYEVIIESSDFNSN